MSEKTYRIGEAATLLNLKTYVLRFWEVEFPQIAPTRTEKGQRLYSEEDVAILRRIRYLLHERGLTIEGARRILAEEAHRTQKAGDTSKKPKPHDSSAGIQGSLPFVDPAIAKEQTIAREEALMELLGLDAEDTAPVESSPNVSAAAHQGQPTQSAVSKKFVHEIREELTSIRDLLVDS